MFRPPKVFRQYSFVKIPDHNFLQKTLILGILFFGTPGIETIKDIEKNLIKNLILDLAKL